MTEALIPTTETGQLRVEKRRDAARDYRRLLNRWVVTAGEDRKDLAEITVLVLNGEDYGEAIAKVS